MGGGGAPRPIEENGPSEPIGRAGARRPKKKATGPKMEVGAPSTGLFHPSRIVRLPTHTGFVEIRARGGSLGGVRKGAACCLLLLEINSPIPVHLCYQLVY